MPPDSIRMTAPQSQRGAWSTFTLVRRNWLVLVADRMNLLLLLGQPVLVAVLLSLAAGDSKEGISKKLFLAGIAVSWLACNNAAQSIVKERAVFLREKLAGLPTSAYLGSKFLIMGVTSVVQTMILYLILAFSGSGLYGHSAWQIIGLLGGGISMTGVGIWISAYSRTTNQALLLVPLAIIPQILLAGYVFPLSGWKGKPLITLVSSFSPSQGVQRIFDVSMLWGKTLDDTDSDYSDYVLGGKHRQNLQEALPGIWARLLVEKDDRKPIALDPGELKKAMPGLPAGVDESLRQKYELGLGEAAKLQMYPNLKRVYRGMPQAAITPELRRSLEFRHWEALHYPAFLLGGTVVLSYLLSWWTLRRARR